METFRETLPPTAPPTEWEKRERDGLLALETTEWREKRLIAEDPNTTGDVLELFADEIIATWTIDVIGMKLRGHLLVESIAAHSNTPLSTLLKLLNLDTYFYKIKRSTPGQKIKWSLNRNELVTWSVSHCVRGMCRNPITPLLCLETPDFWERVDALALGMQLREESLPLGVVAQLTQHTQESVVQSSRLHVSLAGEIQSRSDGLFGLTRYWRTFYDEKSQEPNWSYQKEYAELVYLGMVPAWDIGEQAARKNGDYSDYVRKYAITRLRLMDSMSEFMKFVANLYGTYDLSVRQRDGVSYSWFERLNAALKLPLNADHFSEWYPDPWNRSNFDLMNHLAHDGNRLVRWAAQARLADPDFVFTWQDDSATMPSEADPV